MSDLRAKTIEIIERVVDHVEQRGTPLFHSSADPLPSKREVIAILRGFQEVLFPGYFGEQELYKGNLRAHLADQLYLLGTRLKRETARALLMRDEVPSQARAQRRAGEVVYEVLRRLPEVMELVAGDVEAAYDGDPAATCFEEIILAYPGFKAVWTYRVAHVLYELGVPVIPRIMTEFAHNETGVDIHPGAVIGRYFFIDHGTGVVIGETTKIGDRVKLYQGVTLGALSFPKDERGKLVRGTKRHPTIEDDVVIYAGATILGGETVIGRGAVIGGNVWLTSSVPPYTKVVLSPEQLGYEVRPLSERTDG